MSKIIAKLAFQQSLGIWRHKEHLSLYAHYLGFQAFNTQNSAERLFHAFNRTITVFSPVQLPEEQYEIGILFCDARDLYSLYPLRCKTIYTCPRFDILHKKENYFVLLYTDLTPELVGWVLAIIQHHHRPYQPDTVPLLKGSLQVPISLEIESIIKNHIAPIAPVQPYSIARDSSHALSLTYNKNQEDNADLSIAFSPRDTYHVHYEPSGLKVIWHTPNLILLTQEDDLSENQQRRYIALWNNAEPDPIFWSMILATRHHLLRKPDPHKAGEEDTQC